MLLGAQLRAQLTRRFSTRYGCASLCHADAEGLASRGVTGVNVLTQTTTDKLERLAGFVEVETLRRPEIRTFRLEETGQALAEIEGRHVRGKLGVVPS